MIDRDAIARLKELDAKATPPGWETDYDPFENQGYATCIVIPGFAGQTGTQIARCDHNWKEAERGERRISWAEAQTNAALIVALRNDAPRIITQQEAEIERLREALRDVIECDPGAYEATIARDALGNRNDR